MTRVVTLFAAAAAMLAAALPAHAQSTEISGLVGYTLPVDLENRALELSELEIGGSFTWAIQVGQFFTPRWGVEVLWSEQVSELTIGTNDGSEDLFTMRTRHIHGDAVYQFGSPGARLQPFVFGGAGPASFSAKDLKSETKFSFGLGGGIKYFRSDTIGFRAQFRYKPTMMNDEDAADFCDPFGFCQGTLRQVEVAGGAVVRF